MKLNRRRCGGSVYIVVLGAAMLVTVIGVSGIMLGQVQRRAVTASSDTTRARIGAMTAMEVALFRIARNDNWRTTTTNNSWTVKQALPDGGSFKVRLRDPLDNNLANDPWHAVELDAQATCGPATRHFRCTLIPTIVAANLVDNGGVEEPLTVWAAPTAQVERRTDGPHGHLAYLAVRGRPNVAANAEQDITARLESGRAYKLEAWVRVRGSLVDTPRIGVRVTNLGGTTSEFTLTGVSIADAWVKVSGTITPSWSGAIRSGTFFADTLLTTQDIDIDDVVLIDAGLPPLLPVRGTFRQEVN